MEVYELRTDELLLLEMAAKTADTLLALEEAMVGAQLTVTGSAGQQREHPLLSEARQQRTSLARLLKQLDLPESDSLTSAARAGTRSADARALAAKRWAARSG